MRELIFCKYTQIFAIMCAFVSDILVVGAYLYCYQNIKRVLKCCSKVALLPFCALPAGSFLLFFNIISTLISVYSLKVLSLQTDVFMVCLALCLINI